MIDPASPAWTAAQTAWGEARGEAPVGMQAVLNVIGNRAANPGWWGTDIISVCKAKWQFSCWNPTDPNREKMLRVTLNDIDFARAYGQAMQLVAGTLLDVTGGADSYYAATMKEPPPWSEHARFTRQIGAHRFYITRDLAPSFVA